MRLDDSYVGTTFQQVRRKTMPQRMQTHPLPDPSPIGCLVEQPVELAGRHRLAGLTARKQPAFLRWHARIPTRWTNLPPLPQENEHLGRQHDVAILALRLLDANDVLRPVDVLDLQPHHLAGAQATAIAETEQHANLEATGDGQQATCLVRAHHLRDLLRLAQVIDLGRKIQPPQRHAHQELHPGHDAVAIADAEAALDQVQLEPADVIRRGGLGRALQKSSKTLAAVDVASLRVLPKLARIHVFDHALVQRADNFFTHRQLLSWMRFKTPLSSRQVAPAAIDDLYPAYRSRRWGIPSASLSRSDFVHWRITEMARCPT